jgi:hypothetical protein
MIIDPLALANSTSCFMLREYVIDQVTRLSIEREAKFGFFFLPILIAFKL